MKNFAENNINTDSCESSSLMCGALLFSYFLLDQQKEEYVYSFLEVVPRLVIIRHLLQPVVHLLVRWRREEQQRWRLSSLSSFFVSFFQFIFYIASLSTWFRVSVSNKDFTYRYVNLDFSVAISERRQSLALFRLFCVTGHSGRNLMPWRYGLLLQWQQNTSKAMMWLN